MSMPALFLFWRNVILLVQRYGAATLQVLRKITFFDIFDANATILFNQRHERSNNMARMITNDLGKEIT